MIRLLTSGAADGAMNMAIDEAVLDAVVADVVPPTLRLYFFEPPCVTIGLNQKLDAATIARIRERGFDIARRPTGGRAVLHVNDLTYSFVATARSAGGFLETSVVGAYKQICAGLQAGLRKLGVETELGQSGKQYRQLADCYMATTSADLHHNGVKMIGSAQLRRLDGVLQHGSLPLNQAQELMAQLLGGQDPTDNCADNRAENSAEDALLDSPASAGLLRHANLFDVLGREIKFEAMARAFSEGFAEAFACEVQHGELTAAEFERARSRRQAHLVPVPPDAATVVST